MILEIGTAIWLAYEAFKSEDDKKEDTSKDDCACEEVITVCHCHTKCSCNS